MLKHFSFSFTFCDIFSLFKFLGQKIWGQKSLGKIPGANISNTIIEKYLRNNS